MTRGDLRPRRAIEEAVWLVGGAPHFGAETEGAGFLHVFIGTDFEFVRGAKEEDRGRRVFGDETVRRDGLGGFESEAGAGFGDAFFEKGIDVHRGIEEDHRVGFRGDGFVIGFGVVGRDEGGAGGEMAACAAAAGDDF